ncbi:MAG: polyisoprenoid-binding protein [Hyphomonadaceae bacterium]|nr:polyisoprenoid-binding protein [Hyphomonadaceae bacterium]
MRKIAFGLLGLAVFGMAACSPPAAPPRAEAPAAAEAPAPIAAPAGDYKLDPNHASLVFRVPHMGLSNYTLRFAKLDADVTFDPANITASTLVATVDPKSIRSDYPGDYRGAHPRGPYRSWDEDLAMSGRFLNAGEHPSITFRSTGIERTGPNTARITGDLTLLGQTHPVTLETRLVGSMANHPAYGGGAFGVEAKAVFDRTLFGLDYMAQNGGGVSVEFNGEFKQVVAPATATP